MTEGSVSRDKLPVFSTIAEALRVWPKCIVPQICLVFITVLVSAIFIGALIPIMGLIQENLSDNSEFGDKEILKSIVPIGLLFIIYISFLIALLKISISQYVIVNSIFKGQKYIITDTLISKNPNILAFCALYIITTVSFYIGLYALIVPGIILAINLSQSSIVMILENAWVGASIDRSWSITRGNRWRLFGLWMLFVPVLILAVALAIGGVRLIELQNYGIGVAMMFLYFFVLLAIASFCVPLQIVTYHKLCALKDGSAESPAPEASGAA